MHCRHWSLLVLLWLVSPSRAVAQVMESAGSRALGMGGAFVAVSSDSSATWWNPAGLAAGPFLDLGVSWNELKVGGSQPPAGRTHLSALALGTPPAGVSYYRFRLTDVVPRGSTATGDGDRQGTRTEVTIRSVPASQLGLTLVHTVVPGVHAGTTLKYVRGTFLTSAGSGNAKDLLDLGEDLGGGDSEGHFDLDVGLLAVSGPFRAGLVAKNLREPAFGESGAEARLPRQVRVGGAWDGDSARVVPLTIALDADVKRYEAPTGERRVIAAGVEGWVAKRRLGIRGGGRLNTVGARERAVTGGVSGAIRSGLYLDAYKVWGGSADERGWGLAARVSF